ncbi:MAG: hypothetical protein M3340_09060 [Actinomycetota bacterium]|nr:hypothetical protein [Actinomycetota bacterium]
MRKALTLIVGLLLLSALGPQSAAAEEKELTLYSPAFQTLPYVHDTHSLRLRPNGVEAPDKPGYVTGIKEMVLVDSKDPDAKPLSNARMMIHHLLYFAFGRTGDSPGSCWNGSGFITGRGEEHPDGNFNLVPASVREKYGITNRMPDGSAPSWTLVAMVMNHVKRPKKVYVRTKLFYTEGERTPVHPTVMGCRGNGMSFDVPGGMPKGGNFVDTSTWTVPYDARILLAASHQHGGGKRHTLASDTCNRPLLSANVYHGTPKHIYNTIRPILHEPGPIANGTFGSIEGIPVQQGEVLRRRAVHDGHNLHVASMAFWVLQLVKDDGVGECDPLPGDIRELRRPARYDKTPNHDLKVPQLDKPTGAFAPFAGGPITIADDYFRPPKLEAKVGDTLTWEFKGSKPHTVTVANGPRGFSSLYSGQAIGSHKFKFEVPGTYRLTCLVHPTTMGQTVRVR